MGTIRTIGCFVLCVACFAQNRVTNPASTVSGTITVYANLMGVDCSGATDSSSALQSAINALPNGDTLLFPSKCKVHLSTTVTIADRVAISLVSGSRNVNGEGSTPNFVWTGNGGRMFDIEHSDHPAFIGFYFTCTTKVDTFLLFDGNPGKRIGTAGLVENNVFDGTCGGNSAPNPNFVAISISPTATNNHENYQIIRNNFGCSNSSARLMSHDGAMSSRSTSLSISPDVGFTAAMVSKTIWVSYPSGSVLYNNADTNHGLLKTTIAAFVDSSCDSDGRERLDNAQGRNRSPWTKLWGCNP